MGDQWCTGQTGRDGGDLPVTRGDRPASLGGGYEPFVARHGFPATYARGLARGLGDRLGATLVVTQPEAWAIVSPHFGAAPQAILMTSTLDQPTLDELARSAPDGVTVLGVGGGTAMDVAKWISWRRALPLVQLPTLASVDACFTRMSALRDGERVRYEGDAVPEEVSGDASILLGARRPIARIRRGCALNRALAARHRISGVVDVVALPLPPLLIAVTVTRRYPPISAA